VSELGDLLSNPIVLAIITTLISIGGAALIARIYGERAAARVSLAYGAKRDHDHILTGATLDALENSISQYEQSIKPFVNLSRLPLKLERHWLEEDIDGSTKRERNEEDLLISHLESGYPELFSELKRYRQHFNSITKRLLEIAEIIETRMKGENPFETYSPDKVNYVNWCNYPQAAADFLENSYRVWKYQERGRMAITVQQMNMGTMTAYSIQWIYNIALIQDNNAAQGFKNYLEQLASPEYNEMLIKVYDELASLEAEGAEVRGALDIIKTKNRLGVPLKGYCSAGREAEPRIE
jgi:hypothetical protein